MKKKCIACAILTVLLSFTTLSGCTVQPKTIISVDKSDSVGLVDYYTITYSDGSTSTFTITNGKDGQDAPALTVDDVYEFYKQSNPDITKEEFVNKFLTIEGGATQDDLTALSSLFRSGLKIYSIFKEGSLNTDTSYTGSAVIYKMEQDYTYILTNYHMVYNANATSADKVCYKIFAYMYGSEYAPVRTTSGQIIAEDNYALNCEYVGGSADCDVAILRVPTADMRAYPDAKAVTINGGYQVGQTVYALGNPDGMGLSLTKGIISVDMERVSLDVAGTRDFYLLRTDADLDHGSSGGGLFNADGELIALCNSGDEDIQSINFAIPASTVVPCAEGILYYNDVDSTDHNTYRLKLGVTVQEADCRYEYDYKTNTGNIVADIVVAQSDVGLQNPLAGYPAYKMGLTAGDIIRSININGTPYTISRMFEISNVLMRVRAGDSVTVTYERGGEQVVSTAYTVTKDDLVEA